MHFCTQCGAKVTMQMPKGDETLRLFCDDVKRAEFPFRLLDIKPQQRIWRGAVEIEDTITSLFSLFRCREQLLQSGDVGDTLFDCINRQLPEQFVKRRWKCSL